jgi:hypothetical protein
MRRPVAKKMALCEPIWLIASFRKKEEIVNWDVDTEFRLHSGWACK